MGREKTTIRLEMPGRLVMLEKARELVGRLAAAAGFDEDRREDIQAAVHECLVNAIRHGNRGDETRQVTLELDLHGGDLEIRIRDQGTGFDPRRIPDPLARENLCRSSGRGILLMKALMDDVTFCRPRGGGMEVRMRKRSPRTVESASTSTARGAQGP
jgi:serine/threonine-protein kinase RsbW